MIADLSKAFGFLLFADFHIRINPFIYWKGSVPANRIARSDEILDWSGWNERIEAR